MKVIIDLQSDFNPREDDCVSCPWLSNGCPTNVVVRECPLYNYEIAREISNYELRQMGYMANVEDPHLNGKPVIVYTTEKK
jgi:hypothetical protein